MKARDIQPGDIIEKKTFWPEPVCVLRVWAVGTYCYADVGFMDGRTTRQTPMLLADYDSGGILHPDITKVIRSAEVIYLNTDIRERAEGRDVHNPTIPDWYDYPTEPGVWRLVATDQGRQCRDEVVCVEANMWGELRLKLGSLHADLCKTEGNYTYRYYGPMAPDPLTKIKPWK